MSSKSSTQSSVSSIAPTQLATKVSAPVSPIVGDSSSGLLQESVSKAVPISYGPFVKDVASLHSLHHTILSGSDLEESEVVSVTSKVQSPLTIFLMMGYITNARQLGILLVI